MAWQLQDAKQQFSRLVATAQSDGPQLVTRNGKEVVVVMAVEDFRQLNAPTPAEVLLGTPPDDGFADILDDIVAERRTSKGRRSRVDV